ncbi:hypothetical protein N0V93_009120 [Gnomoniopsis smithogilvyi]|uniref:Thioredoxin domain-containing protein n=1 Tax=Gnomoniopsis smithogilvyi TaxID=1191159 RepID=A0A9W8YMJ4_9PEZI|nr:hypothetical protein N0V93_009120 [Gnomoniopsis smithogilvyi]
MRASRSLLQSLDCLGLTPRAAPSYATRSRYSKRPASHPQRAHFSSTPRRHQEQARNRVYSSVRNADQLTTYLSLSSSSRRPLLTLWTTSWCTTCHQVSPLVKSLIESGVGEAEGGVTYAEIEYDAPDVMTAGLGLTYMINSVPTLLSFDAGEAQVETKVADGNLLRDRRFVEEWIRKEARRHGARGGGGGGGGGGLFGGLFGSFRG